MSSNVWRIGACFLLGTVAMSLGQTFSANWTNSLGMVFVPTPSADVRFCIWETRVRDYAVFVEDGSWAKAWPQRPNFVQTTNDPVVNVAWDEAKEFCIWLTQRERARGLIGSNQVYRLPSDQEWSLAAGLTTESGETPEKRSVVLKRSKVTGYEIKPASRVQESMDVPGNYASGQDAFEFTAPVGSFAPTPAGIYDLHGNVWEWCLDYADDGRRHILRGGSWSNPPLPAKLRDYTLPDNQAANFGFRCVLAERVISL